MDAGAGGNVTVSWDAETIYDFERDATYFGASGGALWYAGADLIFLDEYNTVPIGGASITGGVGIGADLHITRPVTQTIWANNPPPSQSSKPKSQSSKNKKPAAAKTKKKSCSGCGKPIGMGPGYCSGGW